jgi:hypothetical protein
VSGDGILDDLHPRAFGMDVVTMPFPFLTGLSHWQDWFEVHAKFVCHYDTRSNQRSQFHCPSTVKLHSIIGNPFVLLYDPQTMTRIPITLQLDRDVLIARFRAQGDCEAGDNKTDCGF